MVYFKSSNGKVLRCANGNIAATCHCFAAPIIQLSGTLEWLWVVQGRSTSSSLDVNITNVGGTGSELNWLSSFNLGYVSSSPGSGQADFGETDVDSVTLDPSALTAGTYTGTMTVSDSVLSNVIPKTLPITIKVLGCTSYPATFTYWQRDVTLGTTYTTGINRDCITAGYSVRWVLGVVGLVNLWADMHWSIYVLTVPESQATVQMEWYNDAGTDHIRMTEIYSVTGGYLGHNYLYYASTNAADKPAGW